MKIAVVGAGIVGVATAYELALGGHEVTVFDKNTSVAEISSFAPGGSLAASMTQPFSHTTWPKSGTFVRLLSNTAMLPIQDLANLTAWKWLFTWSKARLTDQFASDFAANANLLKQGIARVGAICHEESFEFEQSTGQLTLMQSEAELKIAAAKLEALKSLGVLHTVLSEAELANVEPSLCHPNGAQPAILFAGDLVGNCRQFAQLLKDRAVQAGARFAFNSTVSSIRCHPRIELTVQGGAEALTFDRIVLCTGAAVAELATPLKIKAPLIEAHAYSLSAQMREPLNGPRSAVFDTRSQIGIARIGNRIRATGGFRIGRPNTRTTKRAQDLLYRAIQNHFPGAATLSKSTQFWHANTVISADAKPLIGPTDAPGIYLNVGHGFNGWGMACGAAELLAASIASPSGAGSGSEFTPQRFRH